MIKNLKRVICFVISFNCLLLAEEYKDFKTLAKRALPATVVVQGSLDIPQRSINSIFDLFEDFEGFLGKERQKKAPQKATKVRPSGSGFIIACQKAKSKKGAYVITVVTSHHVITSLNDYYVSIDVNKGEEKKYKADLVGYDELTDIAVLKVTVPTYMKPVKWTDSSKIEVGERCLVAGAPMGNSKSVTAGIISHISQDIYNKSVVEGYVQTDAAINSGNSGGGIFDMSGDVMAVVAMKVNNVYGEGLGYGIPSNTAKRVVNNIIKSGSVQRGWMGISMQKVDEDLALALGLKEPEGIMVRNVESDGPSKGKLKVGDVILEVNKKKIKDPRDVRMIVLNSNIGAVMKIKVLRKDKEQMVNVKIQKAPVGTVSSARTLFPGKNNVNISVADLTAAEKARHNIKGGVKIAKVSTNYSGVKVGDIIVSVNQENVDDARSFVRLVQKHRATNLQGQRKPMILRVLDPNSGVYRFVTMNL